MKDTAADGTLRTLAGIDRAFINVPMAEARDFHCYFHVTDNLGERFIPSDVTVRIVIQKPSGYCGTVKRIPSWTQRLAGTRVTCRLGSGARIWCVSFDVATPGGLCVRK